MKILVCITHVPDTTSKIGFADGNKKFDASGVQFIIGPYDDYALARAVELKEQHGGTITALNVGGPETEVTIRKALAIGADEAVRINAEADDSMFVAKEIANYAKDKGFDLIMMGRESIDNNGGVVHAMVGAVLGIPSVSPVMRLDVAGSIANMDKEIDGGKEVVEAGLPIVVGCQEPIAEWKIPNMRGIMSARTKALEVIEPFVSDKGTSVDNYELPTGKSACKMVDASNVEELVSLLKNEAKIL